MSGDFWGRFREVRFALDSILSKSRIIIKLDILMNLILKVGRIMWGWAFDWQRSSDTPVCWERRMFGNCCTVIFCLCSDRDMVFCFCFPLFFSSSHFITFIELSCLMLMVCEGNFWGKMCHSLAVNARPSPNNLRL